MKMMRSFLSSLGANVRRKFRTVPGLRFPKYVDITFSVNFVRLNSGNRPFIRYEDIVYREDVAEWMRENNIETRNLVPKIMFGSGKESFIIGPVTTKMKEEDALLFKLRWL